MNVILTNAKPYAKAIFDSALNQNKLTEYFRDLKQISEFVIEVEKTQQIDGPRMNPKQKMELFSSLTGQPQEIKNLIKLLIERKKLNMLPDIALSYQKIFFAHKKILKVKMVSAEKLNGSQKKQLLNTLKNRYQTKILLQCSVDKTLTGGALIYIGDKVIDASIKGMLLRLKQNLLLKNTYDKT